MTPGDEFGIISDALIAGFDAVQLSSGDVLSADQKPDSIDAVSDDLLPFLLFDVGRMQFSPWQHWQEQIAWDIPATLKIKGEPGEVDRLMMRTIRDLVLQAKCLMGLPVDENGKVAPYGPTTQRLYELGKLTFLAERGAPYLKSVTTLPAEGSYVVANLVFHLESTVDLDPRGKLPTVQAAILGIQPMTGSLTVDSSLPAPLGIPVLQDSELYAWGGYDTPDPLGGQRRPALRRVAGVAPADQIRSLAMNPQAVTVVTTQQLTCIATFANWRTVYATTGAVWTTSNAAVATVSATGLVTAVAPGTATITATYAGITASCTATV